MPLSPFTQILRLTAPTVLLVSALGNHFVHAQTGQAEAQQDSPFHEETIAEVSSGSEFKGAMLTVSHLAWVESMGGKHVLKLDGKPQGGMYDDIKDINFSADDRHLIFLGKRAVNWVLVEDGQERSPEYTLITSAAFQPQGDSIVYGACQEKKCKLIIDGNETGMEYEEISYPKYSHNGKRLAYLAKRGGKWTAVVDGKEMGPLSDEVWGAAWGFSPDDSHFVYAARTGNAVVKTLVGGQGVKWSWLLDGNPGPAFTVISPISFSSDGRHYAYAGGEVSKQGLLKQETVGTVILDGQTLATYQGKGIGGRMAVSMADGVRGLSSDLHGVSTPQFNPEAKLVYAARREKGDVAIFVGSDAGPGFDEVLTGVAFTKDTQHFAYVARHGKDLVEVQDNKPGRSFSPKHNVSDVPWVYITSDAAHFAYQTVSGGDRYNSGGTPRALRSVIIDGKEGPEYNANGITSFGFDKNALHFTYTVIGAKGDRDLVNVDGHESRLYDFAAYPRFTDDGKKFEFIARDGSRLLRVSYTLEVKN